MPEVTLLSVGAASGRHPVLTDLGFQQRCDMLTFPARLAAAAAHGLVEIPVREYRG